jgi:hypothetical protein
MDISEYVYIGPLSELGFSITYNDRQHHNPKPIDLTYFTKLDQTKFVKSSVARNNIDRVDDKIRSSMIYNNCNIQVVPLGPLGPQYYNNSRKINTTKVKLLKNSLECNIGHKFDLIKYVQGDHFDEFHYDTFRKNNVATLLIFYPCEYTGGDLVFKIGDIVHVVKTSEFKDVMCVIFGNVLHKCTPITSGTRYVFKGSISASLPEILSEINRFTIEAIDKVLSLEIIETEYDDKIKEQKKLIEEKIKDYYKAKIDYAMHNLPRKLDDKNDNIEITDLKSLHSDYVQALCKLKTLENLNSSHSSSYYNLDDKKYNICVLPYYIEDMNNLSSYKKGTLDYIKQLIINGWNVTTLYETFSFKTDFEEECRRFEGAKFYSSASGHEYEDYDGTGYNVNYALHYNISDVECGNCIDCHSEYNDQSGDDIYEKYKCSCLLVWK